MDLKRIVTVKGFWRENVFFTTKGITELVTITTRGMVTSGRSFYRMGGPPLAPEGEEEGYDQLVSSQSATTAGVSALVDCPVLDVDGVHGKKQIASFGCTGQSAGHKVTGLLCVREGLDSLENQGKRAIKRRQGTFKGKLVAPSRIQEDQKGGAKGALLPRKLIAARCIPRHQGKGAIRPLLIPPEPRQGEQTRGAIVALLWRKWFVASVYSEENHSRRVTRLLLHRQLLIVPGWTQGNPTGGETPSGGRKKAVGLWPRKERHPSEQTQESQNWVLTLSGGGKGVTSLLLKQQRCAFGSRGDPGGPKKERGQGLALKEQKEGANISLPKNQTLSGLFRKTQSGGVEAGQGTSGQGAVTWSRGAKPLQPGPGRGGRWWSRRRPGVCRSLQPASSGAWEGYQAQDPFCIV